MGDSEYLISCVDASHGGLKRKAEFEQAAFNLNLILDYGLCHRSSTANS